jgi:hypothetical protein
MGATLAPTQEAKGLKYNVYIYTAPSHTSDKITEQEALRLYSYDTVLVNSFIALEHYVVATTDVLVDAAMHGNSPSITCFGGVDC